MPSIIQTTNAQTLETALIARIAAIVPTYTSRQATGWIPAEDNRAAGSGGLTPRLFYVQVTPGDFVLDGLTGAGDNEVSIGFDVVADYRAFNENEIGTIIEMDQWDLFDDLHDAINIVSGLTHAEKAGEPQADGEETDRRFRFPFTLYYMRARR